ncbi:peptidyl-prolyl cis-trans isomerase C [Anaerosphaera aminiphila DSM 21120]|uniref:Peptidyl-prolyl cis-trans isomerase C n=1 Tax=Anaerosphaera aminiphila DSM 21120 TaxID=1120995 RepID=A0A1M5NSI2_9FIRM|nr:peptidylprolyl isomerase [Anaerosphaera aminiphila]SHG92511.1 peptidyl-prolyl cis-trans isomerase C [Anaerosphaera aminiphila DSM 21120]
MEKKVLATVSDREITLEDYNFFLESLNPQVRAYFSQGGKEKEILDELIYQELLYLDAVENKFDKNEEFINVLDKTKSSLLKTYALGKLLEGIEVSEEEIEEFYNTNVESFNTPKSVNASHILVEIEDLAKEILEKIKNDENFEELAVEFSTCPSKEKGGNLGTFYPGQMVPEFDQAVFSMGVDEISDVVKTQFGFHIIKVNETQDAHKQNLDEVRETVENEVKRSKEQKAYLNKVEELSKKYNVEVKSETGN